MSEGQDAPSTRADRKAEAEATSPSDAVRSAIEERLALVVAPFLRRLNQHSMNPPETIFHYTTSEELLGIWQSQRLRASNILYMNDSSEVQYAREVIQLIANDATNRATSEASRLLLSGIEHVLYPVEMIGGFFAACFCQDGDLLSQWRGYSGGTGGYSLGLGVRDLLLRHINPRPDQIFSIHKIMYDSSEQRSVLTEYFAKVIAVVDELATTFPGQDLVHTLAYVAVQRDMLQCMLMMKNPKFAEEQEWRLIHYRDDFGSRAPQSAVEYRATRSFVVPFVSLDVSPMAGVNHGRVPITKVFVGPTAHPTVAASSIRTMLRQTHAFAQVVNSEIPLRT